MRFLPVVLILGLSLMLPGCKRLFHHHEDSTQAPVQATPTPTATPAPTAPPVVINNNSEAVILCYHRFDENPKPRDLGLAIKPSEFDAQMQQLKDHGITVISMDDFLAWRRGEKNIPAKSAVITIDDGFISGYNTAWPILKKYGYPFTMFIYTDYVKGGKLSGGQSITWDELAEMRDAGVDIESHTVTHPPLNLKKGKPQDQYLQWLQHEIGDSKQILEQNLGIKVRVIAYPYGQFNQFVRDTVKKNGYDAAFTVYGQLIARDAEPTLIGRYAVTSSQPKIFDDAVNFRGPMEGHASRDSGSAESMMPASATMLTIPMDKSTISDPAPEIKANLATFGNVDPKSVEMRVSGYGKVAATYDPATKTVSYKVHPNLRDGSYMVILSANADGQKVATRWQFQFSSTGAPISPAAPAAAPSAPATTSAAPSAPAPAASAAPESSSTPDVIAIPSPSASPAASSSP